MFISGEDTTHTYVAMEPEDYPEWNLISHLFLNKPVSYFGTSTDVNLVTFYEERYPSYGNPSSLDGHHADIFAERFAIAKSDIKVWEDSWQPLVLLHRMMSSKGMDDMGMVSYNGVDYPVIEYGKAVLADFHSFYLSWGFAAARVDFPDQFSVTFFEYFEDVTAANNFLMAAFCLFSFRSNMSRNTFGMYMTPHYPSLATLKKIIDSEKTSFSETATVLQRFFTLYDTDDYQYFVDKNIDMTTVIATNVLFQADTREKVLQALIDLPVSYIKSMGDPLKNF